MATLPSSFLPAAFDPARPVALIAGQGVYPQLIAAAVRRILKIPSLPPQLPADALEGVPEAPGVYRFYGVNDLPLYIGKSVNLRDRIRSHFSGDYRSANDIRISGEIRRIEEGDEVRRPALGEEGGHELSQERGRDVGAREALGLHAVVALDGLDARVGRARAQVVLVALRGEMFLDGNPLHGAPLGAIIALPTRRCARGVSAGPTGWRRTPPA